MAVVWKRLYPIPSDRTRPSVGVSTSPPSGSGSAGPSVTAGGLVFVGATNDSRFRAFDAATGAELWEARLERTGNANPMSYAGASGRQRIAIIAGDRVTVFALP